MNTLRVLHITAELSPFSGQGDHAKYSRLLCRGLADMGLAVTAAIPARALGDNNAGLARRLSPMTLPESVPEGVEASQQAVTLYEGTLPCGRVEVVAIDDSGPESGDPDKRFCAAVAAWTKQRDQTPHIVLATHGGERAMVELVGQFSGKPTATIFILRHFTSSPDLVEALGRADRVVVGSSAWAETLRREPEALAANQIVAPVLDKLRGITPGIDNLEWNPRRDRLLPGEFVDDPQGHKAMCKEEMQRQLGLKVVADVPLIALIGPLDSVLLPYPVCNDLCQRELQLVAVADQERDFRVLRGLTRLANQSSSRIAICTPPNAAQAREIEHKVLAAADFLLIARRYSPIALNELYGMHYGAVPIAPREGGFADILVEFDSPTHTGSGFLFAPSQAERVVAATDRALRVYRQPDSYAALRERVLGLDLSWATAAQRYAHLFLETLREKGHLA